MRRTIGAALAVAILAVPAAAAPRPPLPAHHALWLRVAQCEQPGNGYGGVNWQHRGPRYEGGLGFYYGSWDAYKPKGYPDNAGDATWRQQMNVANRLWARAGWGWGCDKR
jgi:hypothetical protein